MKHIASTAALVVCLIAGGASTASGQQVIISEFMASNSKTLADEDGDFPDWVELYNVGATTVSLDGWYLTDSPTTRTKWRIPDVTLAPGAFKVIFCSGKNRTSTNSNLHTSFKLDADGETIALVRPDGKTTEFEYAPQYPPQQSDVSYGVAFTGSASVLLPAGAPARATVPSSTSTNWLNAAFDDSAWLSGTTGIGYERSTGFEPYIGLDVNAAMYNTRATCYIRVPFTLASVPATGQLTLRMKYDDGFVAYLNGTRVAAANAPATLAYNSAATTTHEDNVAVEWADFDISSHRSLLRVGANMLAIQGLNAGATSSDFLILPQIESYEGSGVDLTNRRYFTVPTPGGPNGLSASDNGPAITEVTHTPAQPMAGQDLLVTARVAPTKDPISTVEMTWRVNYGATQTVVMKDDGLSNDGDANDGLYAATIPASAHAPRQMVRYYIRATDAQGRPSRVPLFANPQASPEYKGTVVQDPSVTSNLPVFWWFVQDPAAAGTETGTRASIFFNGEFYDNVFCRLRGLTSSGWPKKSHKFDMNSGEHFRWDPAQERVEEINLNTSYQDKAYVRVPLAWDTYHEEQVPAPVCRTFHVRQNGEFYCVSYYVEQMDESFLTRSGLDADGALYKMYNTCVSSTSGVEKKTRKWESNADLDALVQGVKLTGSALTTFLYDNVDLPELVNYLAATCVMQDTDHFWTNYYLYRDTDGTGEWQMLPWDRDLTFGRMWFNNTPLNDNILAAYDTTCHPLVGDSAHVHNASGNQWNRFIDALYREPSVKQMYLRRLRTVMDHLLQAPGTPSDQLWYEKRYAEYYAQMYQDVLLDRAKWGNPFGVNQDFATALEVLRTQYLVPRRNHLYVTHGTVGGTVPGAQIGNPPIRFGAIEREPVTGNQDEEYIELVNPNAVAVDISGWTLVGDVSHTFRPGTVIPAGRSLYVTPDVVTFRQRLEAPKGGMGLFVQGNYKGHLAVPAERLSLVAADGTVVASTGLSMTDAADALAVCAGTREVAPERLAELNVVNEGDSAGKVDLADAVAILRDLSGN
jgi:hypothetical protein